jgi:hypothetical protein
MRTLLICAVAVLCFDSVAHARPRRYYSNNNYSTSSNYTVPNSVPNKTSTYTSYVPSSNGGGDQERCQAEANHMAANNITGHVWSCIGSFEGVGYGSSPNCNTCTPSGNMTLTGDASAQGRNGMWYRVRSWR